MKNLSIKEAEYVSDYNVKLVFSDKKTQVVDFGTFLLSHNHPQFNKYKQQKNFRNFMLEGGNIVWGKDWDLIFPIDQLYNGSISL